MSSKATVHIVAGPTASGKSAYAMDLARKVDGVIINCDSQQIYDGLPILSAQPPEEDKAEIPHRLYAELHPNDACSAGNYRERAEPLIEEVLNSSQTPVICGGTGLYIKALIEGLSPIPDIPQNVRNDIVEQYEKLGAEKFYAQLKARDPIMAARFHVNHKARIIRAMEVLEATGKSLAEWQKEKRLTPPAHWGFEIHKIIPEREELYDRCNRRFTWMLDNGALDDVKTFDARLQSGEVKDGVPLCKALGFRELRSFMHGEMSLEDATEKAQGITRRYAKRQTTWFNNQL